MRGVVGYAGVFARFPVALRRFVERPVTLEEAHDRVQAQMAKRQANLLRLLREGVYANPASPLTACSHGGLFPRSDSPYRTAAEHVEALARHGFSVGEDASDRPDEERNRE